MYTCVCVLNLCARIRCAYMCLLCKDRRGAVFHPRQATTTITSAAVDPMQLQRQLAKRPGPYSGGMGSMGRLYWRPMWSMWVCLEMGNRMTSGAPLHAHALSRLRTIMIYQWIYFSIILSEWCTNYGTIQSLLTTTTTTTIYPYIFFVPQHFGQTHASMVQKMWHITATLRARAQVKTPADVGWFLFMVITGDNLSIIAAELWYSSCTSEKQTTSHSFGCSFRWLPWLVQIS